MGNKSFAQTGIDRFADLHVSAQDIQMTLSGDLSNSGTIAGRKLVDLNAQNIDNSGLMQGDVAQLLAKLAPIEQPADAQSTHLFPHTARLGNAAVLFARPPTNI